MKKKKFTHGP